MIVWYRKLLPLLRHNSTEITVSARTILEVAVCHRSDKETILTVWDKTSDTTCEARNEAVVVANLRFRNVRTVTDLSLAFVEPAPIIRTSAWDVAISLALGLSELS